MSGRAPASSAAGVLSEDAATTQRKAPDPGGKAGLADAPPADMAPKQGPVHAEQALAGQALTAETIGRAAQAATEGLELNGDHYASADYRRHLVTVYTRRALERAASRARG